MRSLKFNQGVTVVGKAFCRLIFPINQASVKRWLEIFAYSAIAAPIVGLLIELGYNRFSTFKNDYFPIIVIGWCLFFCALLILWLHWVAGFKPRQVLLYIKYPGFPAAVFLALLFNSCGVRWPSAVERNNEDILWLVTIGYGAILLLIGTCSWIRDFSGQINSVKRQTLVAPKIPLSELSTDQLISWIQDTKEIDDCTEDYFDFAPRADRVIKTLRKK